MTGDEHLYLEATQEAESTEERDPALWAKCMALSNGDGDRAKYMYINQRVEVLKFARLEVDYQQVEYCEEKEQKSPNVDEIVQELEKIHCYASKGEKGEWITYGPYDRVRIFKENNQFLDFAKQMLSDKDNVKSSSFDKLPDESGFKLMSVSELSRIKSIPEDKIIKMIKDGFYSGKIIDGTWYVSGEETIERHECHDKGISSLGINSTLLERMGLSKLRYVFAIFIIFVLFAAYSIIGGGVFGMNLGGVGSLIFIALSLMVWTVVTQKNK